MTSGLSLSAVTLHKDFSEFLLTKGNFKYRVDVSPDPKFPITRDAISQRLRDVCFRLNKHHMKGNGKLLGKQNMTDKFWMIVSPEGDDVLHFRHFHALLNVPDSADTHLMGRTIKQTWCKRPYTRSNSIKSFPYASDRDVEMDIFHHGNYPWERDYLPGSYAKFPLHIVKVEDAKGSLLYNMKDDRNAEDWFFVGLSETRDKRQ